jgi:hypothetical protein
MAVADWGRSSLERMLWTCFSSAPTVKTSVAAMPALARSRVAVAAAGEQRRDEIGVERRSS